MFKIICEQGDSYLNYMNKTMNSYGDILSEKMLGDDLNYNLHYYDTFTIMSM
jgi:hypothetical protein